MKKVFKECSSVSDAAKKLSKMMAELLDMATFIIVKDTVLVA